MDFTYILHFLPGALRNCEGFSFGTGELTQHNSGGMIVFSTVMEVEGRTTYTTYKNRGLAFLNPSNKINAPILYASYPGATWTTKRTADAFIE